MAAGHAANRAAIAQAGAIAPLVELLGSDSTETQGHAVGALRGAVHGPSPLSWENGPPTAPSDHIGRLLSLA